MPQSLSAVYIHLVFSTKERRPLLRDKPTRDALHAYLGGISKQLDCAPILIGGVEDHVHILARFGRTITQAEWVKELKRVSNLWLKERGRDFADFEWQGGYAAFSVSQSNLEQVKQYIAGQEEHHRKMSRRRGICHNRSAAASYFFSPTHATIRSGPPLPPLIFIGNAMTYAPVAGS